MRSRMLHIACTTLALVALSCASPEKLTRQSQQALQEGDAQEAYDKALKALDKEPTNEPARQAMTAAANSLMGGWKSQVVSLAATDTLAAARRCLELDTFRRELSEHRVALKPDTLFAGRERRIRTAAAAVYYGRGTDALAAHQSRVAYDAFIAARSFQPSFRDVEAMVHDAFEKAVEHVAILPFANETDVRGLSMEIATQVQREVGDRVGGKDFRFTVVLSRELVDAKVPVAGLSHMTREEAVKIGRQLGADCVIWGRFFGLTGSSNSDVWHQTLVRHDLTHDDKGNTVDRYVEDPVDLTIRTRAVSIQYQMETVDTETGTVLSTRADLLRSDARTVYTDYSPREDTDAYSLYQPDLKTREPDRAKSLDKGWKDRLGAWSVPELMQHARKEHDRKAYRSDYRGEFAGRGKDHPVFLGDLPPEGELAILALGDMWRPVISVLKELEKAP